MKDVIRSCRQRINRCEPLIGGWLQILHPTAAEIIGRAGFDWVAIDCEHTEATMEHLSQLVRALERYDTVAMARVRENSTMEIRQALDLGIGGVIVPLIHDRASAEAAVAAAKYPPEGIRGFAFHRANAFGLDFSQYVAQANAAISVIAMIESREGVENVDAILSVPGIDGVFIGPYDLSGSYGLAGQLDNPVVTDAIERVILAARSAGKSVGLHQVDPDPTKIAACLKRGLNFLAVGMDTVFLRDAAAQAVAASRGD